VTSEETVAEALAYARRRAARHPDNAILPVIVDQLAAIRAALAGEPVDLSNLTLSVYVVHEFLDGDREFADLLMDAQAVAERLRR
jgi:hypothetical protein